MKRFVRLIYSIRCKARFLLRKKKHRLKILFSAWLAIKAFKVHWFQGPFASIFAFYEPNRACKLQYDKLVSHGAMSKPVLERIGALSFENESKGLT